MNAAWRALTREMPAGLAAKAFRSSAMAVKASPMAMGLAPGVILRKAAVSCPNDQAARNNVKIAARARTELGLGPLILSPPACLFCACFPRRSWKPSPRKYKRRCPRLRHSRRIQRDCAVRKGWQRPAAPPRDRKYGSLYCPRNPPLRECSDFVRDGKDWERRKPGRRQNQARGPPLRARPPRIPDKGRSGRFSPARFGLACPPRKPGFPILRILGSSSARPDYHRKRRSPIAGGYRAIQ